MSTSAPCRNSFDPACGLFGWTLGPHNETGDVQVDYTPIRVKAGDEVTFAWSAVDPDNAFEHCGVGFDIDYGDGDTNIMDNAASCAHFRFARCRPAYGTWTPPEPLGRHERSGVLRHTYERGGAYSITFRIASHRFVGRTGSDEFERGWPGDPDGVCKDPYQNTHQFQMVVCVEPYPADWAASCEYDVTERERQRATLAS